MKLTFWEGLELEAARQVELLQVTELTCTCETIAQSANSTVLLRAEARSAFGHPTSRWPDAVTQNYYQTNTHAGLTF